MDAINYINERLNLVISEIRKALTKWQEDNCYLIDINPYSPDNWEGTYKLFRNNKQFLTDISILFNSYTLGRDMQIGISFDLGKVIIEELQNKHDLACYHYQQRPQLRVMYDGNRSESNYFSAIDINIKCHTYFSEKQILPINELLSKSNHELLHNIAEKRSVFHYYLILMLFQAGHFPTPVDLIEADLKIYFKDNKIGDRAFDQFTVEAFTLQETNMGLVITPLEGPNGYYEGEQDDDIKKIGKKFHVNLRFTDDMYHGSST